MNIINIILPSRPQADTILAIFLLRKFGEKVYPGVSTAQVAFSKHPPEGMSFEKMLEQGTLVLDWGASELDHHAKQGTTLAGLLAKKLGIANDPALEKLLEYAHRDDMYGKGTISKDSLDRAFGLSGLLTTLNKVHAHDHNKVLELVLPLIEAHYTEEYRRTKEMPEEVAQKLASGKAEAFFVEQNGKKLKVIIIENDNPSLPGYLRSQIGGGYDVVAQWSASGHLNILTRPNKLVDLRSLTALIRATELREKGGDKPIDELAHPGKIDDVPEWYLDLATNSLQNGGMSAKHIPVTKIEKIALKKLLELGLSEKLWKPLYK